MGKYRTYAFLCKKIPGDRFSCDKISGAWLHIYFRCSTAVITSKKLSQNGFPVSSEIKSISSSDFLTSCFCTLLSISALSLTLSCCHFFCAETLPLRILSNLSGLVLCTIPKVAFVEGLFDIIVLVTKNEKAY